jgi:hypothetical protein
MCATKDGVEKGTMLVSAASWLADWLNASKDGATGLSDSFLVLTQFTSGHPSNLAQGPHPHTRKRRTHQGLSRRTHQGLRITPFAATRAPSPSPPRRPALSSQRSLLLAVPLALPRGRRARARLSCRPFHP